jgi:MFS family permease
MSDAPPRLYSRRFFIMCGFSLTVFLSAFQLFPTAPFHILALGGTKASAGLFLGLLTYASAFSAPLTGALADRVGKRRMLLTCSLAIAAVSVAYAWSPSYQLLFPIVLVHGLFWSGLLSASAAYMTDLIPESRRAEGIGLWGLSAILGIAVAPSVGFWLLPLGWGYVCASVGALNLAMAAIAWMLDEPRAPALLSHERLFPRRLVEWRVVLHALSLFLYSFGYGAVTSFSALYASGNGVEPKGLYFTTLAAVMVVTRPFSGRLADRVGPRNVFIPCLVLIALGLALLVGGGTRPWLISSAVVFGLGFGAAYPAFVAHVMAHVHPLRRGAAFGGILAAFDTGIGTGSIVSGAIIERFGFRPAFAVGAILAAFSLPYFLVTEKHLPTAAELQSQRVSGGL